MAFGEMQGGDITASDMIEPKIEPSQIQEFYANKNVFITGGTGFLGMVILEKLLRSCPQLKKVYLLARPKKGLTMEERMKKQLDSPIYEKIKARCPTISEKIQLISGDVAEVDFGLSARDKEVLLNEVDVIIHGAATVRFDEHIRLAVNINVRGTRDLIYLAKQMKQLKAFVHISTAYANCPFMEIDEKFYEAPYDYQKLITLVDSANDTTLDQITPTLLGKWPNTYTFTKAVAEHVVKNCGIGLPIVLIRPSQVISTSKEPIAGWINNYYGATGVIYGVAYGLLRTLHCDPEVLADLVPVDLVANCILTAAWDVGNHRSENQEVDQNSEVSILNYVGSIDNPINWKKFMRLCIEAGEDIPSIRSIWCVCFTLNKNKYIHLLYVIFLHFIPGIIADLLLRASGRKPMLLSAYRKIHKFSDVIAYFCTKEWQFHNKNTKALFKKLSPTDKKMFDFDMKGFMWEEYFYTYLRGVRLYLGNDPLETAEQGKRKRQIFKVAHYSICTILVYLLVMFALFLARQIYTF